ncbi:26184_t:CDS:1, partial [Racocetra persica]
MSICFIIIKRVPNLLFIPRAKPIAGTLETKEERSTVETVGHDALLIRLNQCGRTFEYTMIRHHQLKRGE